jgi:Spx/MgsR family transcriptional regulator
VARAAVNAKGPFGGAAMAEPAEIRPAARTGRGQGEGRYDGMSSGQASGVTLYGIKNCDTMKKARAWLDAHGVAYQFHDYKSAGIDRARLEAWCDELGWEALLNRAGTTFRKLGPAEKENLSVAKALSLMLAQPSMIRRPVLERDGRRLVGFRPELYAAEFGAGNGRG